MNENTLRKLLARLHAEIGHAGSLSRESRQELRELADEIDRALQTSQERPAARQVEQTQRLADLVARFDADHPGLAAAMREVMHALGGAGI